MRRSDTSTQAMTPKREKAMRDRTAVLLAVFLLLLILMGGSVADKIAELL